MTTSLATALPRVEDQDLLDRVIAEIKATPNGYWVGMGDFLENAIVGSKSDVYTQVVPPKEQMEHIVELLRPIKDKGLFLIYGNHENRTMRMVGIQPEQYIGGLESDDFSSVQYKVRVNNLAAGTYPAKVIVKFRDASGKWITLEEDANIAISEPPPQEFPLIPLLVVLAVVAAVVYWKFFRKKK